MGGAFFRNRLYLQVRQHSEIVKLQQKNNKQATNQLTNNNINNKKFGQSFNFVHSFANFNDFIFRPDKDYNLRYLIVAFIYYRHMIRNLKVCISCRQAKKGL